MKKIFALLTLCLVCSAAASADGGLTTSTLKVKHLNVRVGVQSPGDRLVRGDVLFIHGFGDRLDNHGPLFEKWNKAGFRVISFDLPSHGEDSGFSNNIDLYSFQELGELAAKVEASTRQDSARPLILSGWSTGGLIATRIVQTGLFEAQGSRAPRGLILLAPAISTPTVIGENGCVTERTLTSNPNPPHRGAISPKSPFFHPVFASELLFAGLEARLGAIPYNFPVITIVGGEREDRYVNTSEIISWVNKQRSLNDERILGVQCPGAFHELDNEPGNVGSEIRSIAAAFAAQTVDASQPDSMSALSSCHSF